jgi:hypothetical protein
MSLLMPELERQLRAVVRDHRDTVAVPKRRLRLRPSGVFTALAVASALAVVAAAVILIGHRQPTAPTAPTAPTPAPAAGQVGFPAECGQRYAPAAVGPLVTLASGSAGGHPWALRTPKGERGPDAIFNGRFVLDGRSYGFCGQPVEFHLIDATNRGIAYGFVNRPNFSISFNLGASARPAITRTVAGGTFFVQALPDSACQHQSLALTASGRINAGHLVTDGAVENYKTCAPDQLVRVGEQSSQSQGPPAGKHSHRPGR